MHSVESKKSTQITDGLSDVVYPVFDRGGKYLYFAASTDGREWRNIGPNIDLEGKYLPPWDRGIRVALLVGGSEGASASFDWLRILPSAASASR